MKPAGEIITDFPAPPKYTAPLLQRIKKEGFTHLKIKADLCIGCMCIGCIAYKTKKTIRPVEYRIKRR